jgi:succinyl-diaminopimelate desuccinylase
LIRIPSVRGEAAPKAPYGIECARAVKAGAALFEEAGFPTRLNEDGGYALATYGEGNTTIGIFGHSDVVPVSAGWLLTEPFEPIVKDGWLVGRGASDNKSGVMIAHSLLSLFRDCDIPLKSKLLAYVGSNEESGMGDITAFVKNEQMPDLSLIPDSAFPCSLGEKGILRMWAESINAPASIKVFKGGDAFNTVLDKITVVIDATPQLVSEIQAKVANNDSFALSNNNDGTVTLTAKGAAMHAAYPFGSINAAVIASKLLCECEHFNNSDKELLSSIVWMLESNYGENLGIKLEDDFGHLTVANGMVDM